ncbi:hypothetical protein MCHI_000475 [Candidatus Magnetoovum chiemensis]|nr:hypothetical protein MCHI_000475 [Candidatus Magnetoovum chiemensis]
MGSNRAGVLLCSHVRRGFNPCFNGSWVQIASSREESTWVMSFQSLF